MNFAQRWRQLQRQLPLLIGVAGVVFLMVFALQRFYASTIPQGMAVDWSYTYAPAARNFFDPYTPLETFTNPPWVLILLPHAWLPPAWGAAVNMVLNISLLLLVIRRFGGNWQTVLLTFTSAPFFDLARTCNVDWIPLLALLVPPAWALPLLAIKPHSLGAIGLIWWKRQGFTWRMFIPLAGVIALSFTVWGLWFTRVGLPWNVGAWNFAPFPYFIPLGLYMLYRAYQTDDAFLAAAATPFLTPYIAVYSVASLIAFTGSKYRREVFIVWCAFWIYFVLSI